jgi:hypothetical protein
LIRNLRRFPKITIRRAVATAAAFAGGAACLLLPATSASAATEGCTDLRVCVYVSTPSKGHVYAQGWADHFSMTGYMTLTGPNGLKSRSATRYWEADRRIWEQWNNIPAVVGQYCVTFQETDGFESSWRACERIT